jgi:hypothetical protein
MFPLGNPLRVFAVGVFHGHRRVGAMIEKKLNHFRIAKIRVKGASMFSWK